MSFTGKATYSAGATLPEIVEDVSDLVSLSSPYETALLDALGDPARPARSTVHEWLEDELLPNTGAVDSGTIAAPEGTTVPVADASFFRVGDLVRMDGAPEVMMVTAVNTDDHELTVTRGYGGTDVTALVASATLRILGNAALEGDAAGAARFTGRARRTNYTQIFSAAVEVSGSELAVRQVGVADELDYQKQQRTRELLRDLENCVLNGVAPAAVPTGNASVRRTMSGILPLIATHRFKPNVAGFPNITALTEDALNLALRRIWAASSGKVDLIVVGGREKRSINQFIGANRRFAAESDTYKDMVSVYESDFGVCRVVLCRSVPTGAVLLLDSSRVEVLPLSGRSFHYKPLASTGDRDGGLVVGEYTLEFRNESAHGVIEGLTA